MNRNFIESTIGAVLMIYGIYEGLNYTGIYKLVAETQLDLMGSYSIKLTIALEMLALTIIWLGAIKLLNALFGIGPGNVERFIKQGAELTSNQQNSQKLRQQAKRTAIIGFFLLLVVSIAALIANNYWQDPPLTTLDLAKDTEPQSSYVEIKALVQPQLILEYTDKSASGTRVHYIIPLTPPKWKQGDPLQYFIDTEITAFQDVNGKLHNYTGESKPFEIQQKFYVNKDELVGMIREEYKRNNIPLKEPHYELKHSRLFAPQDVNLAWMLSAFFITICTLGSSLGSIVGARRLEKSQ